MKDQQAALSHDSSGFLANMIMQQRDISSPSADETIETRFGPITLSSAREITFGKGLLGMPEMTRYSLLDMPIGKWNQFRLLQSLDEAALSFITLPLALDNPILLRADIEEAGKDLGIPAEQLALLLVVSVHREGSKVRLSANARAPIFLHSGERTAEQYVLRDTRYQVRHMISVQK